MDGLIATCRVRRVPRTRPASLLLGVSFSVALALTAAAQTLEVAPARAMADESVAIRAKGLAPGERIAVRAELTDGAGARWVSQAEFVADPQGAVDATTQAPVAGSYKEVSALGLIWSMLPAAKNVATYTPVRDQAPQPIGFQLLRKGQPVANAQLEQVFVADGVTRIPVHDGKLRGVFYIPGGEPQHPGILVVGGSNGGLPLRQAEWLASHGFAALALAYFRYQDLPPQLEGIPLEYFGLALDWMSHRPEIAGNRFAVTGTSRGGELALQLGSMFPRIGAVVAYVPANVRYAACCRNDGAPAWTWNGRALPYVIPRSRGLQTDARAAIEVEKTQGPILMISGEDDHLWPSWEMADAVVSRLKRAHFAYSFENLKYPHAGHDAGRPYITPAWHGRVLNPTSGKENDLGGAAKGDAESSIDSMPRVLEFLKQALASR
jgi:dienelactone hydrolase